MRTLRLIAVCALLTGSGACDGEIAPPPPDGAESPTSLTIWTANLEHLLPEHDWTQFVERAGESPRPPDLLFLTELTAPEADTVVTALEDAAGAAYDFEHAPIGNNAVVWNEARLAIEVEKGPLLWEPFGAAGCSRPSEDDPSEVVGVRLSDERAGIAVVAVGLHWGRTWAAQCMDKNMSALDDLVEKRWPDRPLTIIGGDFNAHPDKQPVPGEPASESLDSGRETDPECWYRAFSALHDQQLETARPGADDRDCGNNRYYSPDADSYIDTVFAAHDPHSLCSQWTSVHGAPVAGGSSCTDLNDDGLRDRGRIDYIWVRWESGGGEVLLPRPSDAIVEAAADRVCILDECAATRYSDHRGVFAEIEVQPPD